MASRKGKKPVRLPFLRDKQGQKNEESEVMDVLEDEERMEEEEESSGEEVDIRQMVLQQNRKKKSGGFQSMGACNLCFS